MGIEKTFRAVGKLQVIDDTNCVASEVTFKKKAEAGWFKSAPVTKDKDLNKFTIQIRDKDLVLLSTGS